MDYLDPKKELQSRVMLLVGYVLVAIAIVIATLVLLYQAYGFGLGKNGTIIQNGLTFFSSHPRPANIYVNNSLQSVKTNTRLVLPAGLYNIKLSRTGYHDWQRKIELNGGRVQHYDYPFLFPKTLTSKKIHGYEMAPGFMTQSPDQRWLLIQQPSSLNDFVVYDLKNPDKEPTNLTLPASVLTKATGNEAWQLDEWADDNQHVLLQHNVDNKTEFVLLDRTDPAQSVNLNSALAINPTKLTLVDKKFDRYFSYDANSASLQTISLKTPTPAPALQHVLAYKTYSDDTILYVTDSDAPSGKVLVRLVIGGKTSTIRSLSAGTSYVVDLTKYSGVMYVAAGAASDNRVYIYKDPAGQLDRQPDHVPVPSQVLHVEQVNYLSFSANAQFIVAENTNRFGVYDIENKTGYNYTTALPLDAPQTHASWMDGNRLIYISGGKLTVFDYDNMNPETLMTAGSSYLPAFSPDYKFVYSLSPAVAAGQFDLNQTALVTPADK